VVGTAPADPLRVKTVSSDNEGNPPCPTNLLGGLPNLHIGQLAICNDQIRSVLAALLDQRSARPSGAKELVPQRWQDCLVMDTHLGLVIGGNDAHRRRNGDLPRHRLCSFVVHGKRHLSEDGA
jgi:hypothetical protein